MRAKLLSCRRSEQGAVAVEFALIAAVFFTVLLGIMEMSRVLFHMNTAAEATRLGARLAVVCDVNSAIVKSKMTNLSGVAAGYINVAYAPAGCSSSTCQSVTVSFVQGANGFKLNTYIPFVPLTINMPAFSTTLTRESLSSANNAVCS